MRFVSKKYDLPYRIVGFAALENTDQEIHINKGWQMTNPIEIGYQTIMKMSKKTPFGNNDESKRSFFVDIHSVSCYDKVRTQKRR